MRAALSSICLFGLLPFVSHAESDTATATYKSGDFKRAIPLLQSACSEATKDPLIRAELLSSLVYEGQVDEASDAAEQAAADFPNSPEVLAARGEFAYYMGDMGEAEKLFKAALKLKEPTPRAVYGLYRLYRAASLYRTARLLCLRAHEIDPDDALITRSWIGYLVPAKRKEVLDAFMSSHPWLYEHADRDRRTSDEVSRELDKRKPFDLSGERQQATLHLITLRDSPDRIRGVGLELSINGSRPLRMLLDTGASGILVKQSAIDKAQLSHLGSGEAWGIGDDDKRNTFETVADTCQIASLKFKTCLLEATEGKGRIGGGEDGLIGADIFSGYLIEIDFERRLLHLTPLPIREPDRQGYDRVMGSDRAGFTPVFRMGNHLYIPTKVNGKTTGLFLLDTGSNSSLIDSTFARLSTKVRGDYYTRVVGVSGRVKSVFEADKAVIQFARYRQENLGLTAFDLNNSPEHEEIRMAGILGCPVLAMFRLTIDYRNGLVKFERNGL